MSFYRLLGIAIFFFFTSSSFDWRLLFFVCINMLILQGIAILCEFKLYKLRKAFGNMCQCVAVPVEFHILVKIPEKLQAYRKKMGNILAPSFDNWRATICFFFSQILRKTHYFIPFDDNVCAVGIKRNISSVRN